MKTHKKAYFKNKLAQALQKSELKPLSSSNNLDTAGGRIARPLTNDRELDEKRYGKN